LCSELSTERNTIEAQTNLSCTRNKQVISDKDCKESVICSIAHASVLSTLLLIGNVESNPGPVDLKEFLGFLYTDTEDPVIKDVLNDLKLPMIEQQTSRK
jgi:hypothetical protein